VRREEEEGGVIFVWFVVKFFPHGVSYRVLGEISPKKAD
jgi:hypothetical protein